MKNNIPHFLTNKLHEKRSYTDKFPDEIKQFLVQYSEFYKWNLNNDYKNIWKLIKHNVSTIPICPIKDCNELCEIKVTKDSCVVSNGCCVEHHKRANNLLKYGVEHTLQLKNVREKIKSTNLKKYGTESPLGNKQIQEKSKATILKKYNVENVMQVNEVVDRGKETKLKKYGSENYNNIEKMKETMISRYGDYNPMRIQKFKNKSAKTCLKRFGTQYHLKSKITRDKIKETNLKKYGVKNSFESDEIRDKIKSTMLERFGVEYPIQDPDIYDKMVKSSYKFVDYIWGTGETSRLQGYEPIVLKELEDNGYTFEDVLTSTGDMPEIWYEFEGKKRRYYPDFYIPSENLIIEVKSPWTLKLHWDKNHAKFEAVKKLGYNFKLEVR